MIELSRGNIVRADAEALVNTVNCVGVMGRGIALQFRKVFPENYKAYKVVCDRKGLQPGMMFVHDRGDFTRPRFIINFPTKRHWKGKSSIEDIEAGLAALVAEVRDRDIRSIAVPPLGCGLGGLDWGDVRPRIERAFSALPDVEVKLFEPEGAPAAETVARERQEPKMTAGRAVLLGLVRRYLSAAMDPSVSLLEVHKLMYFMQAAGQPLRLRYQKAPYGPYAENLRHVLSAIDGYFITGYQDTDDRPGKQLQLGRAAADHAEVFLNNDPDTRERFERVAQLIEGFETPFGMELLATVHWVATREGAGTLEEVVPQVYVWGSRKRMFAADQIRVAWDALASHGWLSGVSPA